MKSNNLILFSILLLSSCTVPYSINHWAAPEDIRPAPPELFGTWYAIDEKGNPDVSSYIRVFPFDSTRFTRSEYPFMFSMDWVGKMYNQSTTDTIPINGVLFKIDTLLFAEFIRVMDDIQLSGRLNETDLYVHEKKYIYLIRSVARDKVEYIDIDSEDLKKAMAAEDLSIYCSEDPKEEQYFIGSTSDLRKILSAYVKMQLFKGDPVTTMVRLPDVKK